MLVNDKGQLTASTRLLAGLGAGVCFLFRSNSNRVITINEIKGIRGYIGSDADGNNKSQVHTRSELG